MFSAILECDILQSMRIEIDQSNKIEKTNKDTILGLANGKSFTVSIRRHVKRKLQEEFRKQGKPRLFVYRTFIAGVVLLLKYADIDNSYEIIIDEEYSGYEMLFRSIFLEMCSRDLKTIPNFSIGNIGKKSNAHDVCYRTMKGKQKADRELKFWELRRLCLK